MSKDKKRISTKTLRALCYIVDDYPALRKQLDMFYEGNTLSSFHNLLKMLHDKPVLCKSWERKFYKNNKEVLKKIQNYSPVLEFIADRQDRDYFYNYLIAHREDLEVIKEVVNKLDGIGVYKIEFDETADFTHETQQVNRNFYYNIFLNYYDNIKVVPGHYFPDICYKTLGSPYKLECKIVPVKEIVNFSKITLNSLVFEEKSLPNAINKECLFDKIVSLDDSIKESKKLVQEVVDLEVYAAILQAETEKVQQNIFNLPSQFSPDYINNIQAIKDYLDTLKLLNAQCYDYIVKQQNLLTEEEYANDKNNELKRRYLKI